MVQLDVSIFGDGFIAATIVDLCGWESDGEVHQMGGRVPSTQTSSQNFFISAFTSGSFFKQLFALPGHLIFLVVSVVGGGKYPH